MSADLPPPLPSDDRRFVVWIAAAIACAISLLMLLLIASMRNASVDGLDGEESRGSVGSQSNQPRSSPPSGDRATEDRGLGVKPEDVTHNSGSQGENSNPKPQADNSEATDVASVLDKPAGESAETDADMPAAADASQATPPTPRTFFSFRGPGAEDLVEGPATAAHEIPGTRSDTFSGRTGGLKERLVNSGGGTAVTEGAVRAALEWLKRQQKSDGSWSLRGPYRDGAVIENEIAATALALLAFQGAGHTHRIDESSDYARVVATGTKALLDRFDPAHHNWTQSQHGGYTEALATISVCELYGMTQDRRFRKPAGDMVRLCLDAQSPQGGWRYRPQSDSDTSVTGWFVMSLYSGRAAGLSVPNSALLKVGQYLDAAATSNGSRYGYQAGTAARRSMTAEGLLCRQLLGWGGNDPRLVDGVNYLLAEPPDWNRLDSYTWYYATQVCHHIQGDPWVAWNGVMREVLPENQIKEGPEAGSWPPQGDPQQNAGGRLYVTCLCTYMLEVYYRHLPIYQ